MRNLFYIACMLLIPSVIFSQPILSQASVFNIGEKYTLIPVDTVGITEGDGGAGKIWDFSTIPILFGPEFEQTVQIVDPSEGFQSDKFPGASYAFKDDTSYIYYKFDGSSLERLGVGFDIGYEFLNNSQLSGKFPFTYKDEVTDTFSGNILMSDGEDEINIRRGGTTKIVADGFGALHLPTGIYDDLLRIKITQTLLDTVDVGIPGLPPVVNRTETEDYIWQSDNYKMPVLHISYITTIQKAMGHEIKNTYKNIYVANVSEEDNSHKELSAPIIVVPLQDAIVKAPFEVEWTEAILQGIKDSDSFSNNSIEYLLEVSTDPSFMQGDVIKAYNAENNTYYTVIDDFDSDMISIRVKAISGEFESEWSETRMVEYDISETDLLPAPVQISPQDGETNVNRHNTTFTWQGNEPTINIEIVTGNSFIYHKGPNESQFTIPDPLSANTTYQWRIREFSGGISQDSSYWSPYWTFTTGDDEGNTIAKPMLIYPTNGAEDVNYTPLIFTWAADEDYVEIDIYNDNGYHYNLDMPNDGKYEFTELEPNTTYQWRLRQYNDAGEYSDWSNSFSFTTGNGTSVRDISTFPIHNIEVYPNPTVGNVVINYNVNKAQEFELYFEDMNGKTIFKQSLGMINEGNHTLSLDLSQYARGNYFITIKGYRCSASRNVILD